MFLSISIVLNYNKIRKSFQESKWKFVNERLILLFPWKSISELYWIKIKFDHSLKYNNFFSFLNSIKEHEFFFKVKRVC